MLERTETLSLPHKKCNEKKAFRNSWRPIRDRELKTWRWTVGPMKNTTTVKFHSLHPVELAAASHFLYRRWKTSNHESVGNRRRIEVINTSLKV
jgi:hypothetical protein